MKRTSLGQHYLTDLSVIGKIIEHAAIGANERVLEIGTGKGILTAELVRVARSLQAYEIDRENYLATKNSVKTPVLRLRLGDAFKAKPRFDTLVSSLPYSESSIFVEWLSQMRYNRAVVILQEDFARKITAKPGDRIYRAVSVIAQVSAGVALESSIPRHAFEPPPHVNSRLVVFVHKRRLTRNNVELIKLLFSLRRRNLRVAMKKIGYHAPMATHLGTWRVNSLTPEQVHELISSAKQTSAAE